MGRKSRGNFLALSGILIAILIGFVSWGAWNFLTEPEEEKKPVIAAGEAPVPTIIGTERTIEEVTSGIAKNVAENKAFNEGQPEEIEQPVKEEEPKLEIPAAITQSKEKGRWLYVDKANFTMYLVNDNEVEKSWGIAVAKKPGQKQRVGDMTTPEGTFPIQQIQNSSSWTHDFKDGKGAIKGAYGPWFIRLKTVTKLKGKTKTWTGIGIHGTHDPDSIGTMVTEGCIRMKNEDVEELKGIAKVGMKVVIGTNAVKK